MLKNIFSKLNNIISERSGISIIILYNLITVILIIALYPIIPRLLNYPPNNEEVSQALGTSNIMQYIIAAIYSCTVGTFLLLKKLKALNGWNKIAPLDENKNRLYELRKNCMNLPASIFLVQVALLNLPLIFLGLFVTGTNGTNKLVVIKVLIISVSAVSVAGVSLYIFTRGILKKILLKTYTGKEPEGKRISIKKNVFIQIIPIFIIALLFTTLLGYTRVIKEKGDLLYSLYNNMIEESFSDVDEIGSVSEAFDILKNIKYNGYSHIYFVKSPDGDITTSDGSILGQYFQYYIDKPYEGNRMFDLNAEVQGIVAKISNRRGSNSDAGISGNNGDWYVGLLYEVASSATINVYVISFFGLLLLCIIVLYYFVTSFSKEISLVANSLTDIAKGEYVDLDKQIPITSNDEIGDLVAAFNRVQEREKEHSQDIEEKQGIMLEQERLASLGQLISGIAHNLRTPIMSIAGAIIALKDLIHEYKDSIGDKSVTDTDHLEIADEMEQWVSKIDPYCTYMSDILTAVKDQTTHSSQKDNPKFTIGELTRKIELLTNNEFERYFCQLITDYNIDKSTIIYGDNSILIQVINNLITNAIQSYTSLGGDVLFSINRVNDRIEFCVKDYGEGIPDAVKNKLFKEMITTKGKDGTGLGLFISYSTIKARFKGSMWFESKLGKGTAFYISIPFDNCCFLLN